MFKKEILLLLVLSIAFLMPAQTPSKYKYKGKEYFVYPFRINNTDDIPTFITSLPDGDYIAFHDYTFKRNYLSLKKETRYKVNDTCLVGALFSLKNNTVNGQATFYYYENIKGKSNLINPKPYCIVSGSFKMGLKNESWKRSFTATNSRVESKYKDGVETGYIIKYNADNSIESRDKYCNGKLCDTVFEYKNNKPFIEYDVDTVKAITNIDNTTVYYFALNEVKINPYQNCKSYFKHFNNDGKLDYELKYKNGSLQPFDSIFCRIEDRSDSAKNEIKKITISKQGNKTTVNIYTKEYYNTTFKEFIFEDGFIIEESEKLYINTYYKKEKKKHSVEKGKVLCLNYNKSYSRSSYIDTNSYKPTLLSESIFDDGSGQKIMYIPKLKFIYFEDRNQKLLTIDTVQRVIYLISKDLTYQQKSKENSVGLSKINTKMYVSESDKKLSDEKYNSYLSKGFLIFSSPESDNYNFKYYEQSYDNVKTIKYQEAIISSKYTFKDTALNGKYFFGDLKKIKIVDPTVRSGLFCNDFRNNDVIEFKNGLKDGFFQSLSFNKLTKIYPNNVKDYFFDEKNKSKVWSYGEEGYKNGEKNGRFVDYINPHLYKNQSGVVKKQIFKSREEHYINDTAHGVFINYYENGNIALEAKYDRGRPDGEYKEYFENGDLRVSYVFDKGKLNGVYQDYNMDNDNRYLLEYANFKNNYIKDSLVFYQINGKPDIAIYTKNDTLLSKKIYYETGVLKEVFQFTNNSNYVIKKEIIESESFIHIVEGLNSNESQLINGHYKNYYDNGQVLSEGNIVKGNLEGPWKFYAINGALVHDVVFTDTTIVLPNNSDTVSITGFYKGFYTNGNKRCEGYLSDIDLDYDCFTKQDKANVKYYTLTFFDINGKQTIKNGNGFYYRYDDKGLPLETGKLINCKHDSLWKFYNPDKRLEAIGNYKLDKKDGIWYEGDLEGINFEDGACFDMTDKNAKKMFDIMSKKISVVKIIYKDGIRISSQLFKSDLNRDKIDNQYNNRVDDY